MVQELSSTVITIFDIVTMRTIRFDAVNWDVKPVKTVLVPESVS